MAEDTPTTNGSPLPPKLDLRRSGIVKPVPPAGGTAAATPTPVTRPIMTPAPTSTTAAAPVQSATPQAAASPSKPVMQTNTAPQPGAQPAWRAKPVVPGARPAGAPVTPRPQMAGTRPATPAPTPITRPTPAAVTPVPAAAVPVSAPTPIVVGPPVSKKETSRIPLTAAKPRPERTEAAADDASSSAAPTPSAAPAAVRVMKLGETAPIAAIPKPSEVVSAEKRKTSRISLEAVMGDEQSQGGSDTGSKTIRLKRPGEAPTIKVTASPRADGDDSGSATTQRKTVVIKRNTEASGARKLSVARPATGDAPGAGPAGGPIPAFLVPAPQPHWAFGVAAIAAALVACVVIYLFCSQAFGPNSSRTLYSYWPGGPDLMWPGKLVGQY